MLIKTNIFLLTLTIVFSFNSLTSIGGETEWRNCVRDVSRDTNYKSKLSDRKCREGKDKSQFKEIYKCSADGRRQINDVDKIERQKCDPLRETKSKPYDPVEAQEKQKLYDECKLNENKIHEDHMNKQDSCIHFQSEGKFKEYNNCMDSIKIPKPNECFKLLRR